MSRDNAPKYVGIVHMGPNYSEPYWETDAYVWDTLEAVRDSLRSIRRGRGVEARVAEWGEDGCAIPGAVDDSLTPCAEDVRAYVLLNGAGVLGLAETDGLAFAREIR